MISNLDCAEQSCNKTQDENKTEKRSTSKHFDGEVTCEWK